MSKGDKKKDKREYEKIKEEWIEMEDLKSPSNQDLGKKFALEEGKQYQPTKIKQENLRPAEQLKEPLGQSQKNANKIPMKHQEILQIKEKNRKKPSLPMTQVTCDYCTVPQQVPGNTQLYICGSCQNMNECYPLYGVVICGCCQSKLGFGFGMSEYVKCTKCGSLMKVPLEAEKHYEAVGQKENSGSGKRGMGVVEKQREKFEYAGFQNKREPDLI